MADAEAAIAAVDVGNPDSLDVVAALRFTETGAEASRRVLIDATSRDAIWAALWVYGTSGADADVVAPLLLHDDASIRTLAAAIAVSLGDQSGFDNLREALVDPTPLYGSEPPMSVADFSARTFDASITAADKPAALNLETDPEAWHNAWVTWFDQHAPALLYQPETRQWTY